MASSRQGKHRRRRQRSLPLPAVAGTATVAVALAGSLSMSTAGANIGASDSTTALQAPARPVASSEPSDEAADPFTDITSASESLTQAMEQASTATHEKIRADEAEEERRQAAERAAREAEERARLAAMYTSPLDGYQVSAQYGVRGWMWARGYHTGLDLTASYGTPVKAVHSGTVTYAGWDGAYGNKVEITHPDGTQTWYAHMSGLAVSGGEVTTGQVIGYVGSTGNSYGNHLHLETHAPGGGELNPYTWLQGKGITL